MIRRSFIKVFGGLLALPLMGAKSRKKLTHDEYCINVCKAQCCKYVKAPNGYAKTHCSHLQDDNRCGIHSEWENNTCNHSYLVQIGKDTVWVQTANVEKVIGKGVMPEWMEEQCCYAHPELLEIEI